MMIKIKCCFVYCYSTEDIGEVFSFCSGSLVQMLTESDLKFVQISTNILMECF